MKFDIIYADPPWQYDNERDNDPKQGGMTYNTLSEEDLCQLPIINISNKDCILFMWATFPKLPQALKVIKSWGFEYKTVVFSWLKIRPKGEIKDGILQIKDIYSGLGHYTNGNQEIVLLARKGGGKIKRIKKDIKQVIISPRGNHSSKPNIVRDKIVELFGDLPRIELFGREKVEGWAVLGNEIDGLDIRDSLKLVIES